MQSSSPHSHVCVRVYIYIYVCPGFATITWFLSAITIHKGGGDTHIIEEKIVQMIIIGPIF